jgi:hypothetical protein
MTKSNVKKVLIFLFSLFVIIIIILSTEWIGVMNRFKDARVDSVVVKPMKVDTTWLDKAKKDR